MKRPFTILAFLLCFGLGRSIFGGGPPNQHSGPSFSPETNHATAAAPASCPAGPATLEDLVGMLGEAAYDQLGFAGPLADFLHKVNPEQLTDAILSRVQSLKKDGKRDSGQLLAFLGETAATLDPDSSLFKDARNMLSDNLKAGVEDGARRSALVGLASLLKFQKGARQFDDILALAENPDAISGSVLPGILKTLDPSHQKVVVDKYLEKISLNRANATKENQDDVEAQSLEAFASIAEYADGAAFEKFFPCPTQPTPGLIPKISGVQMLALAHASVSANADVQACVRNLLGSAFPSPDDLKKSLLSAVEKDKDLQKASRKALQKNARALLLRATTLGLATVGAFDPSPICALLNGCVSIVQGDLWGAALAAASALPGKIGKYPQLFHESKTLLKLAKETQSLVTKYREIQARIDRAETIAQSPGQALGDLEPNLGDLRHRFLSQLKDLGPVMKVAMRVSEFAQKRVEQVTCAIQGLKEKIDGAKGALVSFPQDAVRNASTAAQKLDIFGLFQPQTETKSPTANIFPEFPKQ